MAPKRPTPMEKPPAASSSEEEEETSSGEEEVEEEEEEGSSSEDEEATEGHPQKPSSPTPQTSKPVPNNPGSAAGQESSETESESDSDSDTERASARDSTPVKPIASKPMDETPVSTKKPRSKPSAASPAAKSAMAKRGSETDRDLKDSKRAKIKDEETDGVGEKSEDTKKQLFQRLWSEDDEIAVLKGMIDFAAKKGVDPAKDMNSFCDFIKKSLHFDVSLSQLKDKVFRLRKKFKNNASKGKNGEAKTFAKSHDQQAFELSQKIWGSEQTISGGTESTVKSNGKSRKSGKENKRENGKSLATLKAELGMDATEEKNGENANKMEVEMERNSRLEQTVKFDNTVYISGLENYVIKRGLQMVEGTKKAEMEEKWRKLHVAELELFLKRNDLIREQTQLMLAAYKTEED